MCASYLIDGHRTIEQPHFGESRADEVKDRRDKDQETELPAEGVGGFGRWGGVEAGVDGHGGDGCVCVCVCVCVCI